MAHKSPKLSKIGDSRTDFSNSSKLFPIFQCSASVTRILPPHSPWKRHAEKENEESSRCRTTRPQTKEEIFNYTFPWITRQEIEKIETNMSKIYQAKHFRSSASSVSTGDMVISEGESSKGSTGMSPYWNLKMGSCGNAGVVQHIGRSPSLSLNKKNS